MFCKNCGKMIEESSKFCIACGTKVEPINLVKKIQVEPEKKEVTVAPIVEEVVENTNPIQEPKEEKQEETKSEPKVEQPTSHAEIVDKPSFWFNVLCFFIPIVGLILFITTKKDRPRRAKAMGISALVGYIISVILSIILCIWIFAIGKPNFHVRYRYQVRTPGYTKYYDNYDKYNNNYNYDM